MRLEDIKCGQILTGIEQGKCCEVIALQLIGKNSATLYYKRDGVPQERMLTRIDEPNISIADSGRPWNFSVPAQDFKRAAEACRISLAYLFDPMMAVHTSNVQPLPHQITAVYESMLPRQPLRYVLADDPGAGKTIMAGLLIRELIMRADAKRILIVSPGSLSEQWYDEMSSKFGLQFELFDRRMLDLSHSGNPFDDHDLLIARLDQLARAEDLQEKLRLSSWDLVIVDEAHKMSASFFGNKVSKTQRFRLGELLSKRTRHFLLMTATPHNGKEEDFQLFLSLLDAERFYGKFREGATAKVDVSDIMRRMVKEDLVHIQHRIARLIDSSVAQVQAKGVRTVEGSVAAIWQFPTPESESTYLAQWIKHEIDSQHIRAHDVAILVRKQAVQVEQAIASAFKQQGIRVRNVDRSVGEVKIQDLIGEDLTAIFIPLLRLGATERSPKDWEKTLTNLQMLERVDPSDERTQGRLQEKLAHFVGQLRVELRQHPPAAHSAEDISKKLFQFITPSTLQQGIPSYQRKADFERVRASFVMFLKECAEYGSDWSQTLDEFEGLDQVSLMTVHKSKGLEFHTMIFYGLDNKTWWSLRPDKHEELNAFFVAFTRAKQRAFFSRCDEWGSAISWIEDILHASGVETIDGASILNSM